MNPTKTDHLSSEDSTYLISKLFRDDEDGFPSKEQIYKIPSAYKYKRYFAVTRGLVLATGNVLKVWPSMGRWCHQNCWWQKILYITLPSVFNAKSNTYSIDECNFDNDKFNITNDLCLTLTNIANNGDDIVSNVLETGFSATKIVVLSTHKQAFVSPSWTVDCSRTTLRYYNHEYWQRVTICWNISGTIVNGGRMHGFVCGHTRSHMVMYDINRF